MSVYGYDRTIPDHRADNVGSLPPYTRELHQLLTAGGENTSKTADNHLSHTLQVPGFIVRKGAASDEIKDILNRGCSHRSGVRVTLKEGGGDHVNALVSTLCRENHCNNELEGIAVKEFCLCLRHIIGKPSHNTLIPVTDLHCSVMFQLMKVTFFYFLT